MSNANNTADVSDKPGSQGVSRVFNFLASSWYSNRETPAATLKTITVPAPVDEVTHHVSQDVEDDERPETSEAETTFDEDVDPLFEEYKALAPIFRLDKETDFSGLLSYEPTYNLLDLSHAANHSVSIDPTRVLICDAISQRTILDLPNDRFGSGADLANLAYAICLQPYVPWDFKTDINMANRQQIVNRDKLLQDVSETPYSLVLAAASNDKPVEDILVFSLADFIDPMSGEVKVDHMTDTLAKEEGTRFFVNDVHEFALPHLCDAARELGKQFLYQPLAPYIAVRQLKNLDFVSKYTGPVIAEAKTDIPILSIGNLGKKQELLAPGPEDTTALVQAVASLQEAKTEMSHDNLIRLRDNPRMRGALYSVSATPATTKSVYKRPASMPENNSERPRKEDFELLINAIRAGYPGCLKIAERGLPEESSCFGGVRNSHGKISPAYRAEITKVFQAETDIIRRYVEVVDIFTKKKTVGLPTCPKPVQAALYHLLKTWSHSGCNDAYKNNGPFDYSCFIN